VFVLTPPPRCPHENREGFPISNECACGAISLPERQIVRRPSGRRKTTYFVESSSLALKAADETSWVKSPHFVLHTVSALIEVVTTAGLQKGGGDSSSPPPKVRVSELPA